MSQSVGMSKKEEIIPTNNWIIIEDRTSAGIVESLELYEDINVITKQELVSQPEIRFKPEDKICITTETVLDEVLNRMDDKIRLEKVELLKHKVSCREMLRNIYPDFYFKQILLNDLPDMSFDPAKKYFVKPVKGYWGSGARAIEGETDLPKLVEDIQQELKRNISIFSDKVVSKEAFIIEDCIEGEEYAVDMFYSASGEPVITNICHHPLPENLQYLHVVYYTNHSVFELLYDRMIEFFKKLNQRLQAHSLPIHGEFKLKDDQLTPVELNPLRFGSDGFADLSYHSFRFNPFEQFAHDRAPDWKQLWTNKKTKNYAFYLAYNGTGLDLDTFRPNVRAFRKLFSHILSDIALNYKSQLAFSVVYIEEDNLEKIFELLQIEFKDYFIGTKEYSKQSFWELYRVGIQLRISKDQIVWRQEELGDYLLLILNGNMEVYLESSDGNEIYLDTIKPGEVVGELSALDGLPRSASVRATTDVIAMKISGTFFRSLLQRTPDILDDLFWQQVNRVRKLNRMLSG